MKPSAKKRSKRAEEVRARSNSAKVSEAARADARGRAVSPTIEGYESAVATGDQFLAEALIARHNKRMFNVDSIPEWLRMEILSCVIPAIQLGQAARELGANQNRHPSSMGTTWADQMMWGIDSLIAAVRLLFVGQVAGAAVVARNQLETWTESRASVTGVVKSADETVADFIARTWSEPVDATKVRRGSSVVTFFDDPEQFASQTDPAIEHKHILVGKEQEVCPAVIWMTLSEVLHGRHFAELSEWDANCMADEPSAQTEAAIDLIVAALKLGIVHMRMFLRVAAEDRGAKRVSLLLAELMDDFSTADEDSEEKKSSRALPMPPESVIPPISLLAPLLPNEGLSYRSFRQLRETAAAYEGVMAGLRPAGRLYRDDEIATIAFGWHRHRSAVAAQASLDREQLEQGSLYSPLTLAWRANVWVFVGESAAILGLWLPEGHRRDAALLTATTLRTSWWLWLEDDDRAMAALRTVLEQVCRLRVWRLKPEKATKLEVRSTPRDWIESSGWRRLGPLNKALGEFAHVNARSNWNDARELLTKIQKDQNPDSAPFTARRAALELVTELVAIEIREQIAVHSPSVSASLGQLFAEVGATPGEEERYLQERLDHIWQYRTSGSTIIPE